MNKLFLFIFLLFTYIIVGNICSRGGNSFDMYIGVPGSGKTTFAAYLAKKRLKRGKKHKNRGIVYSNVAIKGCYEIDRDDIGKYLIEDCLLLIDEAGLEYDNRNFKERNLKLNDEEKYFFKYHRHYNVDIALFSQDFDVDKKLRKLCTRLFIVTKSIIPGFIKRKQVTQHIGIDELTKQLTDQYKFTLFGTKWIYAPKLWKLFDSYSRKELPIKEFNKY